MLVQDQPSDIGSQTAAVPLKVSSGPFEHLPDALPVLKDYEIKQKLLQWNLSGALQLQRFRVHRKLAVEDDEALLAEFFQDEGVHRVLELPARLSTKDLRPESSGGACSLQFNRLRVNVTSMTFFDKLTAAGIVARDGSIRGCMDEDFDGVTASDLLTEMLINPDSENSDVFSELDQQEFILQLFSALVIGGGALRQPDSRLLAYEEITRVLYRALMSVKKSLPSANGKRDVEITSRGYRVRGDGLFQGPSSQFHSCFAIIDARKRWLTIWYCPFTASW